MKKVNLLLSFLFVLGFFSASLANFGGGSNLDDPFAPEILINNDTIPFNERYDDFINNPNSNPFDLADPSIIEQNVEYDPATGMYIISEKIGDDYVSNSPYRTKLIPFTNELLNALNNRFKLHIITNGFEEVQHIKLRESGLTHFFDHIITSEMAGAKKPNPKIFEYALNKTNAVIENSVMIGDDINTDISGALNVNMKAIYYNPNQKKHNLSIWREVENLKEIKKILLQNDKVPYNHS